MTVSEFKGVWYVGVREFYEQVGSWAVGVLCVGRLLRLAAAAKTGALNAAVGARSMQRATGP